MGVVAMGSTASIRHSLPPSGPENSVENNPQRLIDVTLVEPLQYLLPRLTASLQDRFRFLGVGTGDHVSEPTRFNQHQTAHQVGTISGHEQGDEASVGVAHEVHLP